MSDNLQSNHYKVRYQNKSSHHKHNLNNQLFPQEYKSHECQPLDAIETISPLNVDKDDDGI